MAQRRASMKPPPEGRCNVFNTRFSRLDFMSPAVDLAAQKKTAAGIRTQALRDVPYWPVGLAHPPPAYRADITGVPERFPLFWNV